MIKISKIILNTLILVWGIYPIASFYQNKNEVNNCIKIFNYSYDFGEVMFFSVYSSLFFAVFCVYDSTKYQENKIISIIISINLLVNILTGFILFISLISPSSTLRNCSNNIIAIISVTAIFPEILFFCLLSISVILILFFLNSFILFINEFIILPLLQKNLKKIAMIGLTLWNALLLWSIMYVNENATMAIGVFQIFLVFSAIILLKLRKMNYFKYNIVVIVCMGITIYFLEVFKSNYGLTTFGIISFISIGFFPIYFIMKRSKKIYKKYLSNKRLNHQEMPKEPPAIYASGEIELYN